MTMNATIRKLATAGLTMVALTVVLVWGGQPARAGQVCAHDLLGVHAVPAAAADSSAVHASDGTPGVQPARAAVGVDEHPCCHCSGTGKCWPCSGSGRVSDHDCSMCNGSGRCYYCNGTGRAD